AAELAAQQITTDRALADLASFVTTGRAHIPEPVHATIVTALASLAELPEVRRPGGTLEAAMQGYGRIDHQLVAVAAAIAATMPDAEYGRMAKSYLALLEARESTALEGCREPAADPVRWLRTVSGTLERLREVEESQLAALSRRAAARAGRG